MERRKNMGRKRKEAEEGEGKGMEGRRGERKVIFTQSMHEEEK